MARIFVPRRLELDLRIGKKILRKLIKADRRKFLTGKCGLLGLHESEIFEINQRHCNKMKAIEGKTGNHSAEALADHFEELQFDPANDLKTNPDPKSALP